MWCPRLILGDEAGFMGGRKEEGHGQQSLLPLGQGHQHLWHPLWQVQVKLHLKSIGMKVPQSQQTTCTGQVEYTSHVGGGGG